MPMTIKQQKFSKLQSKMQPELQAIQKKYKGKNQDQAAMMKMNEETQAVYNKYGVSPMGSCLQLIIQMPILFALYRVIWNIPAYVTSVKNAFMPLAQQLVTMTGVQDFMAEIAKSNAVTFNEMTELTLIDVLYKFKPANWASLAEQFPDIAELVLNTQAQDELLPWSEYRRHTDADHHNSHFNRSNPACNRRSADSDPFRSDTVAQHKADADSG